MMKSILDKTTRKEVIDRISSLNENSKSLWGKMTISQMLRHCAQWDEMAQGKTIYKQSFIGKLFGKGALKNMLKDGPLKKNMPTVPSFKMSGSFNVEEEKNKWIGLLHQYENFSNDGFIHPFFGAMKTEDTGRLVYKHIDHHLKQFGV